MPGIHVTNCKITLRKTIALCLLVVATGMAMAQERDINSLIFSGDNAMKQKNSMVRQSSTKKP